MIAIYENEQSPPVYEWTHQKRTISVEELAKILIMQDPNPVTIQPINVCHNVTFLVDLTRLDDYDDIKADEDGVWHRKGSPNAYITILTNNLGPRKCIYRCSKPHQHPNNYNITLTYYRHSVPPDFSRVITLVKVGSAFYILN